MPKKQAKDKKRKRLAKNKLTGWHGTVHVELDVERGIYSA